MKLLICTVIIIFSAILGHGRGIPAGSTARETNLATKNSTAHDNLTPQHNESTSSSTVNYSTFMGRSFNVLQKYYDSSTGLWNTAGWWNAANSLTVVTKFALVHPSVSAQVQKVLQTTYNEASSHSFMPVKAIIDGAPTTIRVDASAAIVDFFGEYYDDEGWWAMAWILGYDLTKNMDYLETAAKLFADMVNGRTGPCGGMWWNKAHAAEVSITNELFTEIAASLGNRAKRLPGKRIRGGSTSDWYRQWAVYSWQWFNQTGLINADNLINDGLDLATCKNNGATTWTYNQGVILGALSELYVLVGDSRLLDQAVKIATAAIEHLTDGNGILHDSCEPNCGNDGAQFKGIFVRGLLRLQESRPSKVFSQFIRRNAASIHQNDRNAQGQLGLDWAGPVLNPLTAITQTSAMDALVAVLSLSK